MPERTNPPPTGDEPQDGTHPLEQLAGRAEGVTDLDASEQQQQQGGAVGPALDLERIAAGAERVVLGLLRAVRERIAVKMPEIRDEWTDETLMGPAAAAVPVLRKYAIRLLQQLGENEELGVLAFSLMPLVMGFMAAQDKHAKTIDAPAGDPA
jgi:hypothetical protein